jgi:hypothetical protein
MKKKSLPRHFPYQHPTFGTAKRPKPESAWKSSVYYWWWAYLKRNEGYLQCCELGGKGRFASLYKDFGDVRGDDFKAWWTENERGVRLFAEPSAEITVRVLEEGERAPSTNKTLTLSLPLNLPQKFILERCRDLLGRVAKGRRGKVHARESEAPYRVTGQPNLDGLAKALMVYDAIMAMKASGRKKPHWKLAAEMDLVEPDRKVLPTDDSYTAEEKRNVMKATVGRLKRRAMDLIEQSASREFIGRHSKPSV